MAGLRGFRPHAGATLYSQRLLYFLFALAAVCAGCRPALAAIPLSDWKPGRSTYYGPMDGANGSGNTIDNGACGFFNIPRASFPFGFVAAPVQSSARDLFTNNCGSCFEIMCVGTSEWYYPGGAATPCSNSSIVVQVTDSCPCVYPNNQASNSKWCCGDADHFDLSTEAFASIAALEVGHIDMRYRRVSCDFLTTRQETISVNLDEGTNQWWISLRPKFLGGPGAVKDVELQEGSGPWQPMSRTWGATWLITHTTSSHPGKPFTLPISVRITANLTGQQVVISDIIKSFAAPPGTGKPGWDLPSGSQLGSPPTDFEVAPAQPLLGPNFTLARWVFKNGLQPLWGDGSYNALTNYAAAGMGVGDGPAIQVNITAPFGVLRMNVLKGGAALPAAGLLQLSVRVTNATTCPPSLLSMALIGPADLSTIQALGGALNAYRCAHGASPLVWHVGLAAAATVAATSCALPPAAGAGYGSMYAWGPTSAAAVAALWYAEGSTYNYQFPGYEGHAANFTQLVWAGSGFVGCAVGFCPSLQSPQAPSGSLLWVCQLAGAGNLKGLFSANVKPASKPSSSCTGAPAATTTQATLGPIDGSGAIIGRMGSKPDSTSGYTRVAAPLDLSPWGYSAPGGWTSFLLKDLTNRLPGCKFVVDEISWLAPSASPLAVSL